LSPVKTAHPQIQSIPEQEHRNPPTIRSSGSCKEYMSRQNFVTESFSEGFMDDYLRPQPCSLLLSFITLCISGRNKNHVLSSATPLGSESDLPTKKSSGYHEPAPMN